MINVSQNQRNYLPTALMMSAPSQTADLALSENELSKLVFRGAPITDSFYRTQQEGDPPSTV